MPGEVGAPRRRDPHRHQRQAGQHSRRRAEDPRTVVGNRPIGRDGFGVGVRSVPGSYEGRNATFVALGGDCRRPRPGAGLWGALRLQTPQASAEAVPGEPSVDDHLPAQRGQANQPRRRRQGDVENFRLAPRQFGREPQLGEGNIRFSLNRVPDCVDPVKLLARDQQPDRQRPPGRRLLRLPALRRPQRRPRRADRQRRQLLAGDPAGDLLPRPAAGLLPPDRQPGPEQRRHHAVPRRHQLPDPPPPRPRPETVPEGQSPERQGRRPAQRLNRPRARPDAGPTGRIQYFTLYSGWECVRTAA